MKKKKEEEKKEDDKDKEKDKKDEAAKPVKKVVYPLTPFEKTQKTKSIFKEFQSSV